MKKPDINIDMEIVAEILVKLAFGIDIEALAHEYDISSTKIVEMKKNNLDLYIQYFKYWAIDSEVAELGLTPRYERAVSVVKKHYKNNFAIKNDGFLVKNKTVSLWELLPIAKKILEKDNIYNFENISIKNHY